MLSTFFMSAPLSEAPPASASFSFSPTPRQRQILDLLSEGLTDSEVAARLGIATYTVKSHVRIILAHSGSRNKVQAVATYLRTYPSSGEETTLANFS